MTHDPKNASPFLTAEWRYLVMLNYEADPAALQPHVPRGLELDFHDGKTYLSMVGFLFMKTSLRGIPVPFHRKFEEVNLRFYVRREVEDEVRRGVVFVREFVPKRAVAWAANTAYGEHYTALPMEHRIEWDKGEAEYAWRSSGRTHTLSARVEPGDPTQPEEGSEEQFIAEHYWGYTHRGDKPTREYRVEHPPWNVWHRTSATFDADSSTLYGAPFDAFLKAEPASAFIADGLAVAVYPGTLLPEVV